MNKNEFFWNYKRELDILNIDESDIGDINDNEYIIKLISSRKRKLCFQFHSSSSKKNAKSDDELIKEVNKINVTYLFL